MSYFSLRKRAPEPVDEDLDEAVEELDDEAAEDEPSVQEQPGKETGLLGACLLGICGPGAWISARFGTGAAWTVHGIAVWACFFYGGWVAAGLVVTWLVLVLAFIPKEYLDRATAAIERRTNPDKTEGEAHADEPDEPAEETPAGPDPRDVLDLVRDLIGDDRGALLTTLRQPLRAADTRAVREVLAGAGVRVREGVRTARGNGPGVHRDDLPPASPTLDASPGDRVVAGERTNNNTANAPRVQSREGMTIITDPADRHRTHSLKKP
jgi:hypothetical protein